MGSGMARRVLGAGFPLTVYNRNNEKAVPLGAAGAVIARSPREAAKDAQIILSMLADDSAARAVWMGEQGALAGAACGTTLIESSTISVQWVRELAAAAKQKGCELLDSPVTGSKVQANAGELVFLVGGDAQALEKARPVLESMSKSITHLGPTGSGALMKLINNFVCGVQVASFAEALAWLERAGMDVEKALPVMTNGAPGSPLVKAMSQRMTARDYTPNFLLKLLAKDLNYAVKESKSHLDKLTTASTALELLNNAIAQGLGEKDMSAVVEPLRTRSK
jgi:3-hydroxyisobutyrate dehydrogenase